MDIGLVADRDAGGEFVAALSPYDAWARMVEGLPAPPRGGTILQPALIRLREGADRDGLLRLTDDIHSSALRLDGCDMQRLSDWLCGQGLDPLPQVPADATSWSGDDPQFLAYWPVDANTAIIARHRDVFDVLELARPIMAPARAAAIALPPVAAADEDTGHPVVAVIDDGIGFLNARFRRERGDRTRFHAIWLQAFHDVPAPPFGPHYTTAGEMLYRHDIDAILTAFGARLDETAVYRAINRTLVAPGQHRSLDFSFTHGTGVTDIAAGAFPGTGDPAENWPLIGVQLPPEAVDNTPGWQLEPCIVSGVRWILAEMARAFPRRAVVINISFATFAGPKDGTKAIEARIGALLDAWNATRPARATVVYAFGNSRMDQQRAAFRLDARWQHVGWRILPDNRESAHCEMRTIDPGQIGRLGLRITPPQGGTLTLAPTPPGAGWLLHGPGGVIIGRFRHVPARAVLPGVVTPSFYLLSLAPTHPYAATTARGVPGLWRIELQAIDGAPLDARIEVQRGDTPHGYPTRGLQTRLDAETAHGWETPQQNYSLPEPQGPITRAGSHSSFVTARAIGALRVAAAMQDPTAPVHRFRPSLYSAEGAPPVATGPHLSGLADSGPGQRGTVAAGTISGSGRTLTGTSAAAAQVTRCIAVSLMADAAPLPDQAALDAYIALLVATMGLGGQAALMSRQGAGTLFSPPGGRPRR